MNFIIFPHQLFYNNDKKLKEYETIYLIEEPRYFTEFNFHKLKLAYHRASMKKYYDYLKKKKLNIKYIEFSQVNKTFYKSIKNADCINPVDHILEKNLSKLIKLNKLENINFLVKSDEIDKIKKIAYTNKWNFSNFYKYQRTKLDILINNDKPVGNRWSFDTENRLAVPKNHKVVKTKHEKKNKYVIEAIHYVNKHFKNNYGSLDNFIYPIDNKSSIKWLKLFLKNKLDNFGKYEDAVLDNEEFIYHSVLSPMMNIGILTDEQVIKISYEYYNKHKSVGIENFEGFIRQVIGWRNYVYTIYIVDGNKMRKENFLSHNHKLPFDKFWKGETGIIPIDNIINKIINYSYAHHIERLMYLGNFMLLCFIKPNDVYRIFMEWTIDAYDWVMVPNVYGMSQYASINMMTRPYFSSSKYVLRMSNYKKDNNWDVIWDALYYNFINKHQAIFKKNYAIAQQVNNWNNKSKKEQEELIEIATKFLKKL